MQKHMSKWKRAALLLALSGTVSLSGLSVHAAEPDQDPDSGVTTEQDAGQSDGQQGEQQGEQQDGQQGEQQDDGQKDDQQDGQQGDQQDDGQKDDQQDETQSQDTQEQETQEQQDDSGKDSSLLGATQDDETQNGWNEEHTQYYVDGDPLYATVYEIDGDLYGFDWNGYVYTDTEFSFYNSSLGVNQTYLAKESGILYREEWDEYDRYYLADGARAQECLVELDGQMYGFDDYGHIYKDQDFGIYNTSSGNYDYYRAKADGTLYRNEPWFDNSCPQNYYGDDYKRVENIIVEFNYNLYGYNWQGDLYDYEFTLNDKHYLPRNDGSLYRNEWYYTDYGERRYFTDDGSAISEGPHTLDGVTYLFDSYGGVIRNEMTEFDGKLYVTDSEGEVTQSKPLVNGWMTIKLDGETIDLYVKNKSVVKNSVLKIDGSYYLFQSNGAMLSDGSTWLYDQKADRSYRYRAAKSGKLYVNAWYQSWSSWEYYGAGGKGADGLLTISGKNYLFSDGSLLSNAILKVNGVWYASDEEGVAKKLGSKKTGWYEAYGKYYYIKNGEALRNTVEKIGNAYYGFNSWGMMYDDMSFSMYYYDPKTYSGEDRYYRAKAGGALYVNTWYNDGGRYSGVIRYFYYGKGGVAARGLQKIDNKNYYFYYDGEMASDTTETINGLPYVIAKSGVAVRIPNNKWTKVDGRYYYAKNNELLRNRVEKIGSAYYGFNYYGRMLDDEGFGISTYDVEKEEYVDRFYRAKKGGALYVNSWYYYCYYGAKGASPVGVATVGGKKYYFKNGVALRNTYVKDGDKFYFAKENGQLQTIQKSGFFYEDASRIRMVYLSNGKPVKNTWKTVSGKSYYFGSDGYAYRTGVSVIKDKRYAFDQDGTLIKSAWVSGRKSYATASGALATGSMKIGGKSYYFDKEGYKETGVVKVGSSYNLYDKDGVYYGKLNKNGWTNLNSDYYYMKNGVPAEGRMKVGNAFYYFYEGRMMTNLRYTDYESDGEKVYLYGLTGARIQSGWYQMNGLWYYVNPSTHSVYKSGIQTIGGKKYMFRYDGALCMEDYEENGTYYTINKDGVVTGTKKPGDGWTLFGGGYHYRKNGKDYNGWVGNYYIQDGIMLRNSVTPDGYYVGNTGEYQKNAGWVKTVIKKTTGNTVTIIEGRYVKKNSKLANNEWVQISGKWYYFEYYYRVTGPRLIDGIWYIFNDEGALVKTLGRKPKEGWIQVGSKWYYFKDAVFAEGNVKLGNSIYGFNNWDDSLFMNGLPFDYDQWGLDETLTGFYYNKNGVAVTSYNGWQQINKKWYYFGKNGRAITGWLTTGGKTYYFDEEGMATGYRLINGTLHQFAGSGALVKTFTNRQKNGWLQLGGKWYYFLSGSPVTGRFTVGGKTYLFDYNGQLVVNGFYDSYYTDKNGVILRNVWKIVDEEWAYFGADGRRYTGVHKIDGKIYYFRSF